MDQRPNPDQLLKHLPDEAARNPDDRRGRLKLFFGASPGVGKTYAMLEAARLRKRDGVEVVVGIVETHGREETTALLEGLPVLPRRTIDYKGVQLQEFDLEAALTRRPQLLLVDELAHTNAPGSRHSKRWQDVEELLSVGINVYSTLNVQHWESLNDVVAQITGIIVRETVPDTFLKLTNDIELVDLPPDELLKRMREGKVYQGDRAVRAEDHFFQPAKLTALRELALRHVAERVDIQMEAFRQGEGAGEIWPVREHLLVCVTTHPMAPRLLRRAHRMASIMHASWIAVTVETPASAEWPEKTRARLAQNMHLAAQLGAETVTLTGQSVIDELLAFSRARNITRIILGRPSRTRWQEFRSGSIVNEIARRGTGIDLFVVSGEARPETDRTREIDWNIPWVGVGWALLVVAFCTMLGRLALPYLDRTNLLMFYLLGLVGMAYRFDRRVSLVMAVFSLLAFDFFLVPPYFSFAVSDAQYIVTFIIMLGVAFLISYLSNELRQQAEILRRRESRTRILYRMSRALSETPDPEALLQKAWALLNEFYDLPILLLVATGEQSLRVAAGDSMSFGMTPQTMGAAEWVLIRGKAAGLGTDTLAGVGALLVPLTGLQNPVGVLAIRPTDVSFFKHAEELQMLETLASEIGGALESTKISEAAGRNQAEVETQRLRNLLLTSFSFDLRDPLTRLYRRVEELMDPAHTLSDNSRRQLMTEIKAEADRLEQLTEDLPKLLEESE